jgi:hypothetical protein
MEIPEYVRPLGTRIRIWTFVLHFILSATNSLGACAAIIYLSICTAYDHDIKVNTETTIISIIFLTTSFVKLCYVFVFLISQPCYYYFGITFCSWLHITNYGGVNDLPSEYFDKNGSPRKRNQLFHKENKENGMDNRFQGETGM